jgi:hypothetical protein
VFILNPYILQKVKSTKERRAMAKKGGRISGNGPTYGAVVDEKGFVNLHVRFDSGKSEHPSHTFMFYQSGGHQGEGGKWKIAHPIGNYFFNMGS